MPTTNVSLRNCVDCGRTDDHPRHVMVLVDQSEAHHHIDCGARRTPACEHCAAQIEASGDKSGEALRKFLRGDD